MNPYSIVGMCDLWSSRWNMMLQGCTEEVLDGYTRLLDSFAPEVNHIQTHEESLTEAVHHLLFGGEEYWQEK